MTRDVSNVSAPTGRRSVVRAGDGDRIRFEGLTGLAAGGDLLGRSFSPMLLEVSPNGGAERGPFNSIDGEVYLLVLTGPVVLRSEVYAPLTLATGDAVYFDGRSGHSIDSVDGAAGRVLIVVEGEARADPPG